MGGLTMEMVGRLADSLMPAAPVLEHIKVHDRGEQARLLRELAPYGAVPSPFGSLFGVPVVVSDVVPPGFGLAMFRTRPATPSEQRAAVLRGDYLPKDVVVHVVRLPWAEG